MLKKTSEFFGSIITIIVEDGSKRRKFLLPRNKAEGFVYLIEEFEINVQVLSQKSLAQGIDKCTRSGEVLKETRTKQGFTQQVLAEMLGIPQNHISAMEYGKRPIGKKMAQRLAEALNINYREFL